METLELLLYCCLFVFGIILFPVLIQGIASVDMTLWTFAGHEGVAAFLNIFPYIFLMAMTVGPVSMVLRSRTK